MTRTLSYTLLAAAALGFVNAANDWAKPCFAGDCSYDTEKISMKLWGSDTAISDITEAGGWAILNCSPDVQVQDIRLVCVDPAACEHLYQKIGAVGKLVRLPEKCGENPFARVASIWTDPNQEIPEGVAEKIRKEGRAVPQVIGLTLDVDFAAIDPSISGEVQFSVSTLRGVSDTAKTSEAPGEVITDPLVELAWLNFNKTLSTTLPRINLSRTWNIFDRSISCPASGSTPAYSASFHADASVSAQATVRVGIIAAGSLIPPRLTEIALFADLDAQLDALVRVAASATGSFDTGRIALYSIAFSNIGIPGILTISPAFKIDGQVVATIDIGLSVEAGLSYRISGARLIFPETSRRRSTGGFSQTRTPFQLAVTPSSQSGARAEGHIIPALEFGLSALAGIAKATIRLDVDANAVASLTLANVTPRVSQVRGCVDVDTGLGIGLGANANFFGLFDKSTKVTVFSKKWDTFAQCFPKALVNLPVRASEIIDRRASSSVSCPAGGPSTLLSIMSYA